MATPNRTCSVEKCTVKHYARGFCHKHYQRWKKWGDPTAMDPKFLNIKTPCAVSECAKDAFSRGWCRSHYDKWNVHGDPLYRRPGEVRAGKRICSSCGTDTPVKDMRRTLCAPCMSERSRSYYSYTPRAEAMICEACGDEYKGYLAKTKYCGDSCREVGLQAAKTVRDRRIRQTTVERFSRAEIFDRDGWNCHLCGEGIPLVAKYPHPLSASLDHVIPIALGGHHTRQNSAASHFRCNVRKGARATV